MITSILDQQCGDCQSCLQCVRLYQVQPDTTVCYFTPSRFNRKPAIEQGQPVRVELIITPDRETWAISAGGFDDQAEED